MFLGFLQPNLTISVYDAELHTSLKSLPQWEYKGLYKLTTSIIRILHFTCVSLDYFAGKGKKQLNFLEEVNNTPLALSLEPFSSFQAGGTHSQKIWAFDGLPIRFKLFPLFHLAALSFLRNDYGGNFLLLWAWWKDVHISSWKKKVS